MIVLTADFLLIFIVCLIYLVLDFFRRAMHNCWEACKVLKEVLLFDDYVCVGNEWNKKKRDD